ncbi:MULTISPECIES: class I SAM-dependent methyltransferase [Clostridium]|uniref:class I SAM-dependent methyltransferase n=1 Tax=Clostridium TaxID=1485 RepID=UPI000826E08A|nr:MULTISPECIES: class I SAM-dependent methyltransferase [Clostridium]PJI06839.1 class I SAM-dependent methyltransferase [Clostridium sp. CT7]
MKFIFRQPQLYRFLNMCNEEGLEKTVLDCGAGGKMPPLSVFLENGYKTSGIEISDKQIERAEVFSKEHKVNLNISKGDMRKLPFENDSFDYVYSYNSIFHMKKADIKKAVSEIKRVLKPGGLCLVNFLSVNDEDYGKGERAGDSEFFRIEDGEKILHSYYDINEAEEYFKDMKILFKENRILEKIYEGQKIKQGYVDYILRKSL